MTATLPPYPSPSGATARRLDWRFLPPALRARIEERLGTEVIEARSCDGGFTPGFASVLIGADGSRHFVKAASAVAQRMFAESYRHEARKLAALPPEVPAPRLLWSLDDDWVVLGIEHVEGRAPLRPWDAGELVSLLDALERCADVLTPVPDGLDLDTFAGENAVLAEHWRDVPALHPHLPADRVAEAAALAALVGTRPEVTVGDTLVHTDVRDDNALVRPDGSVVLCDWNWPVRGAAWLDTVMALVGPRGDGLDVEALLAARPLTRGVPAEHVDALLALLAGYFLTQGEAVHVPHSPHLREHQAWQGAVCWDWLAERRGW